MKALYNLLVCLLIDFDLFNSLLVYLFVNLLADLLIYLIFFVRRVRRQIGDFYEDIANRRRRIYRDSYGC